MIERFSYLRHLLNTQQKNVNKNQAFSLTIQHARDSTAGLSTENAKKETVAAAIVSSAQAQPCFTQMLTK